MNKWIPFVLLVFTILGRTQNDFWKAADGPFGGKIDAIRVYQGKIFAIRSSRIFLSTDGGNSWMDITGPVSNIRCMSINPSGDLYLGVLYQGVWWTQNNGGSWSNNQITRDPHSGLGATILAMGIDSLGHIFTPDFRSFDGGNTWQEINPPSLANTFAFGSRGRIFIGTYTGVYLSSDNGTTWIARNTGIENISIKSLQIDADGNIYAGSPDHGVFYSPDNGLNWISRNAGLGSVTVTTLDISPEGDIYAGTAEHGIFRSTNQGNTWSVINGNLADQHIRTIAIGTNSEIYLGTEAGGIFKSVDNGVTWSPKNQNINVQDLSDAVTLGSNDYFLASRGSGIFYSADGNNNWTARNNGLANLVITDLTNNNSGEMFAATYRGVFRSSDSGATWIPANHGIENEIVSQIKTSTSGVLYALISTSSFGSLFYSNNNGTDWNQISFGNNDIFIESIAVASQGYLFVSATNFFLEGLVLVSPDGGMTWSDTVLASFSSESFLEIDYSGGLYAVFKGNEFFYSDDAGENWIAINSVGMPSDVKISHLAFDSHNNIYAETKADGFFYSEDGGNNWIPVNDGLPLIGGHYPVFNFLYVNQFDMVFAGTDDLGLFIGGNNVTSIVSLAKIPAYFALQQNYPNPFNPSTTIPFLVFQAGELQIEVVNTLGQKVKTLFDGHAGIGRHLVRWDGTDFNGNSAASGIYFYRLIQQGHALTGKMLLMR
jgi:photosystem II stability/assembly factor-like uncharacterized protein